MTPLLVFLGAAAGAPLRYLVGRLVRSRHDSAFPWGTLVVNVVGSFALGCLTGAAPPVVAFAGTGLCGGFTTYSTFSFETVGLLEAGAHRQAFANIALSLVGGVGAAALGYALTR